MRRVGYYGGSFNPCHIGHQMTALQALSLLDIETLIVVPAYLHAEGKTLAPYEHRLEMSKRMVRPLSGTYKNVYVSRAEEEAYKKGSNGLTSEVLKHVFEQFNHDAHISLILGSDLKEHVAAWRGFDDLADMVKAGKLSFVFFDRWLDVSSTKVRALYARAQGGSPEDYRLVPEDIRWYIQNTHLYKE